MKLVGNIRHRVSPTHLLLNWLRQVSTSTASADYEAWQHQFLIDRLQLSSRLIFYFFLSAIALSILVIPHDSSGWFWLIGDVVMLTSAALCLLLHKNRFGRTHPDALFLGLCWAVIWFSQLRISLLGHAEPDLGIWSLVFLTFAVAIPIRWRLHLTAHIGALILFFALNLGFGQVSSLPLTEQVMIWMFIVWISFCCILGVYLYEQLRRDEFEARRELQTLIQTISQDLRSPTLKSLSLLKRSLEQTGEQIAIAHATLEEIYQSSDRQLTLIEVLLEQARGTTKHNFTLTTAAILQSTWLANQHQAIAIAFNGLAQQLYTTPLKRLSHIRLFQATAPLKEVISEDSYAASTDYKLWRYHFLINRLQLVGWVGLGALCALGLPTIYSAIADPHKSSDLIPHGVISVCLILWFLFYRSRFGHSQPDLAFLGLVLSFTVGLQVGIMLIGLRYPEGFIWTVIFLMFATLIPVQWKLHLLAQIMTIAAYFVLVLIYGSDPEMEVADAISFSWYIGWVCLICDLGVYTYERLQRAEFESRQQLQVFLHSVTHDLRTPVIGTAMVLSRLLKKPNDPVVMPRSTLERIVQGGDRQMRLIDSLLEAHVNTKAEMPHHPQAIALDPVVQAVLADIEPLVLQSRANLTNLISTPGAIVHADPTQLWRVFENLITNALKYNPPGVNVTLNATVEGDYMRCTVQDSGIGISPDLHDRLFDLYSRGTHNRRSPGLGLGLYLCRQIIHAHQGEIGVNSYPGKGTTFWFTLPRRDAMNRVPAVGE
ncbi:MAG: ATP-binding protein [Oculatellaceae cyanobacterium bins.114]|nr:ATP-binding protein [Oculatellaceae cyanobacterium bins.114]